MTVEVAPSPPEPRLPATGEAPATAEGPGGAPKHSESGLPADAVAEAGPAAAVSQAPAAATLAALQAPAASAPATAPALGPVASPESPALLTARRTVRDALLLKAFPTVVESAYAAATAGPAFAAPAITPVLALDAQTAPTRDGRTHGVGREPTEHELPPALPLGEGGGGSSGGAAAGGGSGSASSAPSALVAPLRHAGPGAVRLLAIAQPTWRTSFFVLIPERPD